MLSGLTTRGRSFLVAGIAAIGGAVLLGESALLRVGILLACLPLASTVVVVLTRYRITSSRQLEPTRVSIGHEAGVMLRFANASRLPTGLLLVTDHIPYALGPHPRYVLNHIEPRGQRQTRYPISADVRGRFELGPLTVQVTDPFGMSRLARSFPEKNALTVIPEVTALPEVRLVGNWLSHDDSPARATTAAGNKDDLATREYRYGDDLRRVHWRSTARHGELMVRQEEQPWRRRCTIVLDTREYAHGGSGPTSSFEWAVSAAASIGVHLHQRGYTVRLLADAEPATLNTEVTGELTASGADVMGILLETVAVARTWREGSLRGVTEILHSSSGDGLLVALLGNLSRDEAAALAQSCRGAALGIAFLLNGCLWGVRPEQYGAEKRIRLEENVLVLRRAGWRVTPVNTGDSLPTLWQSLGQHIDLTSAPGRAS